MRALSCRERGYVLKRAPPLLPRLRGFWLCGCPWLARDHAGGCRGLHAAQRDQALRVEAHGQVTNLQFQYHNDVDLLYREMSATQTELQHLRGLSERYEVEARNELAAMEQRHNGVVQQLLDEIRLAHREQQAAHRVLNDERNHHADTLAQQQSQLQQQRQYIQQ